MTADWIAFGYFVYLTLCGGIAPRVSWRRRLLTVALSLLLAWLALQAASSSSPGTIGGAAWHAPLRAQLVAAGAIPDVATAPSDPRAWSVWPLWRVWLPLVWLLAGYWLPALLWRGPMPRVEAWLQASDRWLTRTPLAAARERPLLEAAYLLVHPIVPAAWLVLQGGGHAALADRFWSATLTAGFFCYGTLPWIQTRPPRLLARIDGPESAPGIASTAGELEDDRRHALRERHRPGMSDVRVRAASRMPAAAGVSDAPDARDARPHGLRALNHQLLRLVGVRANTFPSGHAAIATVVALCVLSAMPLAGLAFLLLAALIAVATVVCRYHYTADTLLGVLLGEAVWAGIWLRP